MSMKLLAILIAFIATPALANDRSFTVTNFDRVRIEGTFIVDIMTGRGPSARITGTGQAIERTIIENQGQMLVIKSRPGAWGGWHGENAGPTIIKLTTSELRTIGSSGASTVTIDHMRGAAVTVGQDGSGALAVGSVDADTLDIGMAGTGSLKVAGKAAQTRAAIRGAGIFDASALAVSDLRLTSDGSAVGRATASRSANIVANGTGTITIIGKPACTVVNKGSGSVVCGH